ncbi:hypothetical protein OROGR_022945 [Orobanche gracilis]
MVSVEDIPPSSLLHIEEPYAAQCQAQTSGQKAGSASKSRQDHNSLSDDLEKYIANITSSGFCTEQNFDHKHECGGVNWPIVLPSEIVLAGRIFLRGGKFECIILLCQIKVNSIAIVRLNSLDEKELMVPSTMLSVAGNALTSTVEQVKVGQAIYSAGSLFNHSCQPNVHAYFLSRTLYVRSTEYVAAGYPLELSYGPHVQLVGQWDCKGRQQLLKHQYSFSCQCNACSGINLSDLVLNAFRCSKPTCFGAVPDGHLLCEKQMVSPYLDNHTTCSSNPHLQRGTDFDHHYEPGVCLTCGSHVNLEMSAEALNEATQNSKRIVGDLVDRDRALCGKNKEAALESKHNENDCFAKANYANALRFYSKALRDAPSDVDVMGRNLVSTLYLNCATVLHRVFTRLQLGPCDFSSLHKGMIQTMLSKCFFR